MLPIGKVRSLENPQVQGNCFKSIMLSYAMDGRATLLKFVGDLITAPTFNYCWHDLAMSTMTPVEIIILIVIALAQAR